MGSSYGSYLSLSSIDFDINNFNFKKFVDLEPEFKKNISKIHHLELTKNGYIFDSF